MKKAIHAFSQAILSLGLLAAGPVFAQSTLVDANGKQIASLLQDDLAEFTFGKLIVSVPVGVNGFATGTHQTYDPIYSYPTPDCTGTPYVDPAEAVHLPTRGVFLADGHQPNPSYVTVGTLFFVLPSATPTTINLVSRQDALQVSPCVARAAPPYPTATLLPVQKITLSGFTAPFAVK